jgi:heptosyltransferase II
MAYRRILVRATNWVGDAVMSVPALQAVRQRYPEAHISILARSWVAGLYGREPFCDELIPYAAPRGWRGWAEKRSTIRDLRADSFDCAILLPNSFEAAALAACAGIVEIIGYKGDGRSWLLTQAIEKPKRGEVPAHQRF